MSGMSLLCIPTVLRSEAVSGAAVLTVGSSRRRLPNNASCKNGGLLQNFKQSQTVSELRLLLLWRCPLGRPKLVEPTERVHFHMPQGLYARIALSLHSEVEGRVPYGAWGNLINPLLKEHLEHSTLDLAPYLGKPAGAFLVKGHPTVLASLEQKLKGQP